MDAIAAIQLLMGIIMLFNVAVFVVWCYRKWEKIQMDETKPASTSAKPERKVKCHFCQKEVDESEAFLYAIVRWIEERWCCKECFKKL